MSFRLPKIPSDPILGIVSKFKADPNPKKLNLSIGEYVLKGKLYKFNCVKKAEQDIAKELEHRYLPIEGNSEFLKEHAKIIFPEKEDHSELLKYQSLSGTGALNLSGSILKILGFNSIYLPNLTWANHNNIYSSYGLNIKNYKYLEKENKIKKLEVSVAHPMDDLIKKIVESCNKSCFLFQANGNNPTGLNYTKEMINEIIPYLKKYNKTVIIDNAYQGLSSYSYKKDVEFITELDNHKVPMIIASSCAKNLGLYGQRVGSLICSLYSNDEFIINLDSNIKKIIRGTYSSPPKYGSLIAEKVFKKYKKEWEEECKELVLNLGETRELLYEVLKKME